MAADAFYSVGLQLAVQLCIGCCGSLQGLPHGVASPPCLRGLPPLQQGYADVQGLPRNKPHRLSCAASRKTLQLTLQCISE